MTHARPLGSQRLKAAALAICDRRIKACQDAEFRYDAMILGELEGGSALGSLELAKMLAATERSARMEAEHIRDLISKLEPAKR